MRLVPAADIWLNTIRNHAQPVGADARAAFGLATDRPVAMAGHQAGWYHPGILAKRLALEALADATGADAAWLVVDTDSASAPGGMWAPTRDASGRLTRTKWDWLDAAEQNAGRALPGSSAPARSIGKPALTADHPESADRVVERMNARADAPSLAMQAASAVEDELLDAGLVSRPAHLIPTSALLDHAAARQWLARMAAAPAECVNAYNAALPAAPESARPAALPPADDPAHQELPLWRIGADGRRATATAADVRAAIEGDAGFALAPKALLLTAAARAVLCDLFIHGTGGGASRFDNADDAPGYDRAAEGWFHAWLGVDLAPSVIATADSPLQAGATAPDQADLQRVVALAHRAAHDPALLGDRTGGARKRELLRKIDETADADRERADAFRDMHDTIDAARREHQPELSAYESAAQATRAQHNEAQLLAARDWPFVWIERDRQHALRDAIRATFDQANSDTMPR